MSPSPSVALLAAGLVLLRVVLVLALVFLVVVERPRGAVRVERDRALELVLWLRPRDAGRFLTVLWRPTAVSRRPAAPVSVVGMALVSTARGIPVVPSVDSP